MSSILTYHKIGRQFEFGITSVTWGRFTDHLEFLKGLGKEWALASDVALSLRAGDTISLTFDDGYESVYTKGFPGMSARGISGTIFPVVGAVGGHNTWDVRLSPRPFKHLSWRQIEELARHGFEVGSHTLSHRDLTRLSEQDLMRELVVSRHEVEDHLGAEVRAIAYPFGKTDDRVIEAARGAGYKCGFVSAPNRPLNAGCALHHDAEMAVGRMSVYAFDDARSLQRKLGLAPGYRLEALKSKIITHLSHGTALVRR